MTSSFRKNIGYYWPAILSKTKRRNPCAENRHTDYTCKTHRPLLHPKRKRQRQLFNCWYSELPKFIIPQNYIFFCELCCSNKCWLNISKLVCVVITITSIFIFFHILFCLSNKNLRSQSPISLVLHIMLFFVKYKNSG